MFFSSYIHLTEKGQILQTSIGPLIMSSILKCQILSGKWFGVSANTMPDPTFGFK